MFKVKIISKKNLGTTCNNGKENEHKDNLKNIIYIIYKI